MRLLLWLMMLVWLAGCTSEYSNVPEPTGEWVPANSPRLTGEAAPGSRPTRLYSPGQGS